MAEPKYDKMFIKILTTLAFKFKFLLKTGGL